MTQEEKLALLEKLFNQAAAEDRRFEFADGRMDIISRIDGQFLASGNRTEGIEFVEVTYGKGDFVRILWADFPGDLDLARAPTHMMYSQAFNRDGTLVDLQECSPIC